MNTQSHNQSQAPCNMDRKEVRAGIILLVKR